MGLLDGIFGSIFGSKDARDANRTNKDIAEVNTLTSGIQELFNEIESTLTTDQLSQFQEALTQIEKSNQLQTQTGTEATEQERSQTQTGVVQRGSETGQAALDELISSLSGGGTDTGAAMDAAIRRVLESGAPQISNVLAQSGSFDNTTAALLQNDLITRAADAAAQVDLQQQNEQTQQLLDAVAAGQSGTETTTQDLEEAVTGTTDTTSETATESESSTESTRDATEQTTTTEEEVTSEAQTGVTQEFKDVSDAVQPAAGSDLNELVREGQTTDVDLTAETPPTTSGDGAEPDPDAIPVRPGAGDDLHLEDVVTGGGTNPFKIQAEPQGIVAGQTPDTMPSLDGVIEPDAAVQTLRQLEAAPEGQGGDTALEAELLRIAQGAQ